MQKTASLIWFTLKYINFALVLTVFVNTFSLILLSRVILMDNTPLVWSISMGIANTLLFIIPLLIGGGILLFIAIFSLRIVYIEKAYIYLRKIIGFIVYFAGVYMALSRIYDNDKSVFEYSFDDKVYFWGQLFIMVFLGIILFDWLGKKLRDKCETLLS